MAAEESVDSAGAGAVENGGLYSGKNLQGPTTPLRRAVAELRLLWTLAAPVTLLNLAFYFRASFSAACLGRLGRMELSGGALAVGFTNIMGYSLLSGLAAGLEPVLSAACGRRDHRLLSITLQRAVILLSAAAAPVAILWSLLGLILRRFLRQDAAISAHAAVYAAALLPDLLTQSLVLQPLRVYLRSQNLTTPLGYCAAAALAIHPPLTIALVFGFDFGVPGAAAANVLTNIILASILLFYLRWASRRGIAAWTGWAPLSVALDPKELLPLIRLMASSCAGICLEWWWYEIITLAAGYLPDPSAAIAATSIVIQTTSLMYTLPMALAGCVSARVGNELGAGRPSRAKLATLVALGCAAVGGILNFLWTVAASGKWARVFTNDSGVVNLASKVLPLIGACELANCPQTTACGVLRGTARPAVGARINFISFYLVGMPVAIGLAFMGGFGFPGLWVGLLAAQIVCVGMVLWVVLRTDWRGEANRAMALTIATGGGGGGGGISMGLVDAFTTDCDYDDDISGRCKEEVMEKHGLLP